MVYNGNLLSCGEDTATGKITAERKNKNYIPVGYIRRVRWRHRTSPSVT